MASTSSGPKGLIGSAEATSCAASSLFSVVASSAVSCSSATAWPWGESIGAGAGISRLITFSSIQTRASAINRLPSSTLGRGL